MKSATDLHGVIPMLVAPLRADGSVELAELRGLGELVLTEGAHGLAVNGLAGEAGALTIEERNAIVTAALEAAGGEPVVAGCSAESTEIACVLARHAAESGAKAIMVAPPSNPDFTADRIDEYYATVAAAIAPTAVMVQDAPTELGVALAEGLVPRLRRDHPNVCYAKIESTLAPDAVARLAAEPEVRVFGGQGGVHLLDLLAAGAHGVIPGCEHAAGFASVYEAVAQGHQEDARARFARLQPLLVAESQSLSVFIASVKTILVARGVISRADLRGMADPLGPCSRTLLLEHARAAGALEAQLGPVSR